MVEAAEREFLRIVSSPERAEPCPFAEQWNRAVENWLSIKYPNSNTQSSYRRDFKQLVKYLVEEQEISDWQDVKISHIQEYVKELPRKGYVKKTIRRKRALIRSFFRYLSVEGFVLEKPPKLETLGPQLLLRRESRILTDQEIEQIDSCADPRDKTMFWLALAGGLKTKELEKLEVKNISWEDGKLVIDLTQEVKRWEIITLEQEPSKKVKEYLSSCAGLAPETRIFRSQRGKNAGKKITRQALWLSLHNLSQRSGVEFNPHDLRQTYLAKKHPRK